MPDKHWGLGTASEFESPALRSCSQCDNATLEMASRSCIIELLVRHVQYPFRISGATTRSPLLFLHLAFCRHPDRAKRRGIPLRLSIPSKLKANSRVPFGFGGRGFLRNFLAVNNKSQSPDPSKAKGRAPEKAPRMLSPCRFSTPSGSPGC